MKQSELIKIMADAPVVPITQAQASDVLKAIVTAIKDDTLENGNATTIAGLGTFKQQKTNARGGRNPKTGEAIVIPSRTKLIFKMSSSLKD